MIISLLGSTLVFVAGIIFIRNQVLRYEVADDAERVVEAIDERVTAVTTAATLLADDPEILAAISTDGEEALRSLNGRAVVVRDRFGLDLIQLYDQEDVARTNLVLSSLYRESVLLDRVSSGPPIVEVIDGRMLLLARTPMTGGAGTVIVGVDLGAELTRIASEYHLSSELGLRVADKIIGTRPGLAFDDPQGWPEEQQIQHISATLGQTPVELLVVRSTAHITQLSTTVLVAMTGGVLFTTLALMGLSVVITRHITQPIDQLSSAAELVAQGDLSQRIDLSHLVNPFGVGSEDEIEMLIVAFNGMVAELRELYGSLEAKVAARTQELTATARVARTISTTGLNLSAVLSTSAALIQEHLGFYHVGIFILEPGAGALVLREAAGKVAWLLKNQQLKIVVGSRSLIGQAAASGEPQVTQDVATEPTYLAHPLLPDTRSEAAIPLLVGQSLIGVLDVQGQQQDAFTPEIIQLLMALADQIAVGVHNAQIYAQQRQMAERLAAANARLQELDQIKSEFIQNVSHELRTPLALIRGYAEALESGMLGELSEEQHRPVSVIARRSRIMSELVESITALLEVEAEAMSMGPVAIGVLARDVLDDFRALAERQELTLRGEIKENLPQVTGDEHHLRKVVDNLVNNAIKFTPTKGEVTVRLFSQDGHVVLQVADTGIGIPPEKQARVFERFYQVDGSVRRRYGGTGLGLALVKEIVAAHGGAVSLQSAVGQGTTFTVELPVG
jgi:signal transduction histidine kinase